VRTHIKTAKREFFTFSGSSVFVSSSIVVLYPCILCLGIVESINNNVLSIKEYYFISPFTAQILKEKGSSDELVNIIYLLCELENVERIVPSKLESSLEDAKDKLIKYLDSMPEIQLPKEYWIKFN